MTSKMAPDVTIWFKTLFFLGHFSVSSSLEWTSSVELPDNFTIAACAGQDVTLAWAYNLTANESVIDVEWLFRPKEDTAADVIATEVHGHFFTVASSGANVQFIPVAGIRLQGVSLSDSGTYSVHVNVNVRGISTVFHVQSVNVDVTSTSLTTDGQLQTHMIGARYLNSTQQHHIILTCGIFNVLWVPRVNVLWTTPMNQTVSSTFEDNGQFELAVPNPFVSGEYTCTIDKSSPASLCVTSNSPLARGATVMVDGTEGRISLMASELKMTTSKLQATESELHATESELHTTESRLQATESEVRALQHNISSLQTENAVLKANITHLQSQLGKGR